MFLQHMDRSIVYTKPPPKIWWLSVRKIDIPCRGATGITEFRMAVRRANHSAIAAKVFITMKKKCRALNKLYILEYALEIFIEVEALGYLLMKPSQFRRKSPLGSTRTYVLEEEM